MDSKNTNLSAESIICFNIKRWTVKVGFFYGKISVGPLCNASTDFNASTLQRTLCPALPNCPWCFWRPSQGMHSLLLFAICFAECFWRPCCWCAPAVANVPTAIVSLLLLTSLMLLASHYTSGIPSVVCLFWGSLSPCCCPLHVCFWCHRRCWRSYIADILLFLDLSLCSLLFLATCYCWRPCSCWPPCGAVDVVSVICCQCLYGSSTGRGSPPPLRCV